MKKSHQLLSEAGESLDYLRDEVRTLGLYVTELETLVEAYHAFVVNAKLLSIPEIARRTMLLRETEDVLGLAPVALGSDESGMAAMTPAVRRAGRPAPGTHST